MTNEQINEVVVGTNLVSGKGRLTLIAAHKLATAFGTSAKL